MKPKPSTLTSGELHQNEHVDELRACCLFCHSFLTCVTVCMFEVGSDSVVVFRFFSSLACGMASVPPIQLDVADSTRRSPHAVYTVSSLLRPDGTAQTTSQVTLDQFPNFINGNEVQLFVQTHGTVHLRNAQSHSSSPTTYAMRDQSADHEAALCSRSSAPRCSRVKLTPGPHGKSDEDDDWGEWTHHGRRRHEPMSHATRTQCCSFTIDNQTPTVGLIQLSVCTPSPSLGSHISCFAQAWRLSESPSGSTTYCTTPFAVLLSWSIQIQPNGSNLGSQCTRSLMPHRENIIRDARRVRSVSELWFFVTSPGDSALPEQLSVQLGVLEKCWPYIRKTAKAYHCFKPSKKDRAIASGSSSPSSRATGCRIISAHSRSRLSIRRTTRTLNPPSAS